MARENQGLQIALIIFVILTIMLGVTTFIFFRQYEEAALKAASNLAKANEETTRAHNIQAENNELKRLMGFDPTDKLDAIHEQYNDDMEKYAANYEETNRVYRKVLGYLQTVIDEKSVSLADEQVALQEQKDLNERREAGKDPQIAQHETAARAAEADAAALRRTFNDDRTAVTEQKNAIQVDLVKAQKAFDAEVTKLGDKLKESNEQLQQLYRLNKEKSEQLEKVFKPTFEAADGKIRWVNQRNGTVWISLGRADALARQTSFSVYPADTNDVTQAGKKGSIEVTQILGDHLAEARIIEDEISNPLMPGDVIHTPVWAPGEREHFALSDGMDIDGDGRSDLQRVINLITMNGGVVDCFLDDEGNQTGKIGTGTRFLVLGDAPDADALKERIDRRTALLREADRLGLRTISLQELLARMGWKNQTPVIRFGSSANPNDFRAKPPEGVPKKSSGTVSDIFRKREPPRRSGGSAY